MFVLIGVEGLDFFKYELITPGLIKIVWGYLRGLSKKAHYAHGWERLATEGCGYPGNQHCGQDGRRRIGVPAVDDPALDLKILCRPYPYRCGAWKGRARWFRRRSAVKPWGHSRR